MACAIIHLQCFDPFYSCCLNYFYHFGWEYGGLIMAKFNKIWRFCCLLIGDSKHINIMIPNYYFHREFWSIYKLF